MATSVMSNNFERFEVVTKRHGVVVRVVRGSSVLSRSFLDRFSIKSSIHFGSSLPCLTICSTRSSKFASKMSSSILIVC